MKIKVGILIYSLSGGGAERVVSYLLSYLESKQIDCTLFLMNDTRYYTIPKGISIVFLEKSNPLESGIKKILKIPYLSFKYYRLLKKHKIDVSISFLTRPNYINILTKFFRRSQKIIISERSYPSQAYKGAGLKPIINSCLIKIIYPFANLVIPNSEGNAIDLIKNFGIDKNKIRIIKNPVNTIGIDSIEPIEYFYDEKYINFVTVGRLDDGKNHSLLINAIKIVNNPAVRLYIFGEGVNYDKLLNLIAESELECQVFLMGFKKDIYRYMKAADCFLFGSLMEGFPNVLLEAIACQLPIITTNCKSGPDEILFGKILEINDIKKSELGILVPENNLKLFITALNYFINNRDEFNGSKVIFSKKLDSYNPEKILSSYYQCLIDL